MSIGQFDYDQVPFGNTTNDIDAGFTDVGLAENPEPRCPLVLLLDTSGSMAGAAIRELNEGLVVFKDELSADELALKRIEVAVITFGPVEIMNDFLTVDHYHPSLLKSSGSTPMGEAINRGLDLLESRKAVYRQNGISYFRPWVMLLTDGGPTDHWQEAAERVHRGEAAKSFSFFAIAVKNANMERLEQIAVRQPLKLKGLQFREFFLWLSNSMQSVSQSTVGDVVPLENPATPSGWAEV